MSYGNDDNYQRMEQQRREDESRRDEQRRFQQQQDDNRRRQDEIKRMDAAAHYRKREESERLESYLREKKADEQRFYDNENAKGREDAYRVDAQRTQDDDRSTKRLRDIANLEDLRRIKDDEQELLQAEKRWADVVENSKYRTKTWREIFPADQPIGNLLGLVMTLCLFALPPFGMWEGLIRAIRFLPKWTQYPGLAGQIATFYSNLFLDGFTSIYQYIQLSVKAKNYWMLSAYYVGAWASILGYFALLIVAPKFIKVLMLLTTATVIGSVVVIVYRLA